ncbi:MAG: D-tyrosyl-tRNA(Tyr) deacylase [Bacteroidetes bacterium]|nr:D-tyrosyl-tRNA(Tyr) deacylase [Bacteroidota bacterium]
MRALIQRVSAASVRVDGETIASIDSGMVVLLGIGDEDDTTDLDWLVGKVARLRIFDDEEGVMNWSLNPEHHQVIVVSQFTLHASTKKGNRPSYIRAARPEKAQPMYLEFVRVLTHESGCTVQMGSFGANMQVDLVNNGPVTIWIDSKNRE